MPKFQKIMFTLPTIQSSDCKRKHLGMSNPFLNYANFDLGNVIEKLDIYIYDLQKMLKLVILTQERRTGWEVPCWSVLCGRLCKQPTAIGCRSIIQQL